jgi:hypothetical protein
MLGRQALYHLIHASYLFCSGYFGVRVSLFVQASLDHNPPIYTSGVARMKGACHCTQLLVEMDVLLTFPRLVLNHDPPNLSLPHEPPAHDLFKTVMR